MSVLLTVRMRATQIVHSQLKAELAFVFRLIRGMRPTPLVFPFLVQTFPTLTSQHRHRRMVLVPVYPLIRGIQLSLTAF